MLTIIKIMKINHSYEDFVAILHDGKIPLELKIALYIKGTLEYLKYSQEFCHDFLVYEEVLFIAIVNMFD